MSVLETRITILRPAIVSALLCSSISTAGSVEIKDPCIPHWAASVGGQPGVSGDPNVGELVRSLQVFDDGAGRGPGLFVGGIFTVAGGVPAKNIAKWNGDTWLPIGSGVNASVRAMTVFDDGTGPALYVGGSFTSAGGVPCNRIARWNGSTWSPLGTGVSGTGDVAVNALYVFDDGQGMRLYVGGTFTSAGGVTASCIARWDGGAWSSLEGGMTNGVPTSVSSFAAYDDGTRTALYVGGNFTTAGGVSAHNIARWDGTTWAGLGAGTSAGFETSVYALDVFDGGAGPELIIAGSFASAGLMNANNIAKWNGSNWSSLGVGVNGAVRALAVHRAGEALELYVGGSFSAASGVPAARLATWSGSTWSASSGPIVGHVWALDSADDGTSPDTSLYVGGKLDSAGGVIAENVARFEGTNWFALGSGFNAAVRDVCQYDDGSGTATYIAGEFKTIAGVPVNHIVRWDGHAWTPLGQGVYENGSSSQWAGVLEVFDDGRGDGPSLYVGGRFKLAGDVEALSIAQWNGESWSALGNGLAGGSVGPTVYAMAVFDDGAGRGPALYVAGDFITAGGAISHHIAKWDGVQWWPVGGGVSGGVNSTNISALAVFDDGDGPALYAGGNFTMAGGVPTSRIAKWDGQSWSALGSGIAGGAPPSVYALATFRQSAPGTPNALYVGGLFTTAGGVSANCIARWDGSAWSAVGTGLTGGVSLQPFVESLTVFDDGLANGPYLFAGGHFLFSNGPVLNHVAKWNGVSWTALGAGVGGDANARVRTLTPIDDGSGSGLSLLVGGRFQSSPAGDSYLAKWKGCAVPPSVMGDVNGDGAVNVTDLLAVISSWGPCENPCPPRCAPDIAPPLTGDCQVDIADLLLVIANWG